MRGRRVFTAYCDRGGDKHCKSITGVQPTPNEIRVMRLHTNTEKVRYFDFDKKVFGWVLKIKGVTLGTELKQMGVF